MSAQAGSDNRRRTALLEWIAHSGVQVGLAAHDLASGEEILIQADRSLHPASLIKICVMMEAFRQARQGPLSLAQAVGIRNEFSSLADGSAYALSPADDSETDLYGHIGASFPLRELIERMITLSSNLATNLLIERLTAARITQFMQELGTDDVIVRRGVEDNRAFQLGLNNAASPRGLMQILLKLARRQVVSPSDSDEMIATLLRQRFNEMIPAQLPPRARVAHKTGWTGRFHHDAGIVYPPGRDAFVLVIMTEGFAGQADARPFIAALARQLYDGWAG